ncbi:hypothetical protein [Amycolatopsis sp. NBC_00355]
MDEPAARASGSRPVVVLQRGQTASAVIDQPLRLRSVVRRGTGAN